MLLVLCLLCPGLSAMPQGQTLQSDYPIQAVPMTQVRVQGGFWGPRLETNRRVTIPYDFQKCEETGRIDNFAKAGGLMPGPFIGIRYNDSDVFKVIEGASYALALQADPELEAYLDRLIAKIAAAQEEDGYLYTTRTIDPNRPARAAGETRWAFLEHSHELYNVGHMYEAAVAHYQATGKRSLLEVALKNADLIDRTFGPNKRRDIPGHQEIEIGLMKLYRLTGEARYLHLARFFLDERGQANGRSLYGEYCQDHAPVTEQKEAVGHAVRAVYMYSAMTDAAALFQDSAYRRAVDWLWTDVTQRKMYLTGGIGAHRHGEAFGKAYELPNASAYNETCAAIALALWAQRMFLLNGDAHYVDVLERVLYNGFLAGVDLSGTEFFYPNPLEASGRSPFNQGSPVRAPWFDCSCCPVNVVRFLPAIPGFAFAIQETSLFVNLFLQAEGRGQISGQDVAWNMQTEYPFQGKVRLQFPMERGVDFALKLRIPGWARNQPVPSDLYRFATPSKEKVEITVNGIEAEWKWERGYAVLERRWEPGDWLEMQLPMPIRRVVADSRVQADRGKVALQRGPLVYCVEGVDHAGAVSHLSLPAQADFQVLQNPDFLDGCPVLVTEQAEASKRTSGGEVETANALLRALPYYAWAHRGATAMTVWLPEDGEYAKALPIPTIASLAKASASHCWSGDTVEAIHDLEIPQHSGDHDLPRLTWWDHRGTREWVQYDFDQPTTLDHCRVYWFDDTGRGSCRLPKSWRLLYVQAGEWREVEAWKVDRIHRDAFNEMRFKALTTTALRLEVDLQEGFSGGILEWQVGSE